MRFLVERAPEKNIDFIASGIGLKGFANVDEARGCTFTEFGLGLDNMHKVFYSLFSREIDVGVWRRKYVSTTRGRKGGEINTHILPNGI